MSSIDSDKKKKKTKLELKDNADLVKDLRNSPSVSTLVQQSKFGSK